MLLAFTLGVGLGKLKIGIVASSIPCVDGYAACAIKLSAIALRVVSIRATPDGFTAAANETRLAFAPCSHTVIMPPKLALIDPLHVLTFRAGFSYECPIAGMVKWYHASFPSSWRGFDSRYPLQRIDLSIKDQSRD